MNAWLETGQQFLSENSAAVYVAAGLIAATGLLLYLTWFRPAVVRLHGALKGLAKSLEAPSDGWPAIKGHAQVAAKRHFAVQKAWQETEGRVIPLPHGQRTLFVMFGAPRDLWSANRLLSRSINLPLAEAVPNLLVGVGLLFTFFFLTLALTEATSALVPQAGQQATDLTGATRGLLSAAGAKFMTSLAGLGASIVWAVFARRRMAILHAAVEEVLDRISHIVSPHGGEMAMYAQLQLGRDLQQSSANHVEATKEGLGKAQDQIDLTQELLDEAREQSGTFKRFETDLAVSLAGAITSAFSPQMEAMTTRLIAAIDGLSDKIGTMNQKALQQMMHDFGGMLKKETESEMTQLRATLETLAGRLTDAGNAIGDGAGNAADRLDKAGADLLARVEQVSDNLANGAKNLEGATQGVKEAMNDLDVTISQATQVGRQGSAFVQGALETADAVFGRLKLASEEINAAGTALERVSGQLVDAVDGVEEMTKEQRAVVNAVKDATPQAMASVQRVLDLLQETVDATATAMLQTKDSMASTSKTLGSTVAQITEGISEYSNMVAALHRAMDEQLAKAVGSLDKAVTSLDDNIEDLTEVLDSRLAKAA